MTYLTAALLALFVVVVLALVALFVVVVLATRVFPSEPYGPADGLTPADEEAADRFVDALLDAASRV